MSVFGSGDKTNWTPLSEAPYITQPAGLSNGIVGSYWGKHQLHPQSWTNGNAGFPDRSSILYKENTACPVKSVNISTS